MEVLFREIQEDVMHSLTGQQPKIDSIHVSKDMEQLLQCEHRLLSQPSTSAVLGGKMKKNKQLEPQGKLHGIGIKEKMRDPQLHTQPQHISHKHPQHRILPKTMSPASILHPLFPLLKNQANHPLLLGAVNCILPTEQRSFELVL